MERSKKKVDALLLSFNAWMADRRPRPLRPVTRYHYTQRIRRAMKVAEDTGHTLIAGDLRVVRLVLGSAPPHPASQNGFLNALIQFYEFLRQQGLRKDNPALEIGRAPKFKGSPRPLSIEDCCRYLDAASKLSTAHYAIAVLGMYMGLRRGEMRTLRWADFFEVGGRWWCDVEGKGGRRARVPVHPMARAVVTRMRQTHAEPTYVFASPIAARWGQPVGTDYIRRRHLQTLEASGIAYCTPHQLRHSFATYLRRSGVDIAVVQKGLRHLHLTSTEVYTAVLDDELADAIDGLDFYRMNEDDRKKGSA